MIRLIVQHEPVDMLPIDRPTSTGRRIQFLAHIEGSGEFVVQSHQPLADGARELLARGYDPETMLTMRHAGGRFDSFNPEPLRVWAAISYTEPDREILKRVVWRPISDDTDVRKSGSDEGAAIPTPEDDDHPVPVVRRTQ